MKKTINIINERIEKQSQLNNNKIKKVQLPTINTKETILNIVQHKSNLRNPQSANLSNKILNNAIEIGNKIYNRDIITPNIVNMNTILEKENKDYINNNNNINLFNNRSSHKNRINSKYSINHKRSSLNNKHGIVVTDRNRRNSDLELMNNEIPVKIKEQLANLNNMNNINKYLNSNKKKIFIKINDNNNLKSNPVNIFSKNNINNKSSSLLKQMNIPYLLNEKNNNICLNNMNNNNIIYQSIDRKEISKETSHYIKLVNNRVRQINKSENNSKIK